jgi:hypothetical protein
MPEDRAVSGRPFPRKSDTRSSEHRETPTVTSRTIEGVKTMVRSWILKYGVLAALVLSAGAGKKWG